MKPVQVRFLVWLVLGYSGWLVTAVVAEECFMVDEPVFLKTGIQAYPADPTADIAWSAGYSGVADIQAAFNNARSVENSQLGTSVPALTMPAQAAWDAYTDGEKCLWLVNRERLDRSIQALSGVEANVTGVAQYYATYLLANNTSGHEADGRTPWERLDANPAIHVCHNTLNISENLAYFVTTGSSIALPVERSVYNWMYKDKNSSWGHRHMLLWNPYNDDSGPSGTEGFMGLGRATGGPYQGSFTESYPLAEILVMNVFDPCSTWPYDTPTPTPTPTAKPNIVEVINILLNATPTPTPAPTPTPTPTPGQNPKDMALIDEGNFVMGSLTNLFPGEGMSWEWPQHTVHVEAFYMGKYEVTKALWDEVRTWALANGYGFENAGAGKAANHPVHSINWYDAVKWCNAWSQKEGLTPCYTVNGSIYQTGNNSNVVCNWAANGYRLPTEAEWEKAADGGYQYTRFPWADWNISHLQANYYGNSGTYAYDDSNGYHPTYNDGSVPYSSPVGSFAPNGPGLYDMAGNMWEWVWDWHAPYYYAVSPNAAPTGPAGGAQRVLRGGAWNYPADRARCANRLSCDYAVNERNDEGFRCARSVGAVPGSMVSIPPPGSFVMGNASNVFPAADGHPDEFPQHTVEISSFNMDKYEVTKGLWDEVKNYNGGSGYSYSNPGSGKAANHPVHTVNWYDVVKWCNARSQKEGLTPVYYTDAGFSTIYKTGELTPYANWAANGYRLPTEAEWEKAARGGAANHRFPWTDVDTISHARENYYASSAWYYDLSDGGCHPAYATGAQPYTSPVGDFAPNGYGLHNLVGNVTEWCWDWYSSSYYSTSPGVDPRGPATGSHRALRGANWAGDANDTQVSARRVGGATPDSANFYTGFRCVKWP